MMMIWLLFLRSDVTTNGYMISLFITHLLFLLMASVVAAYVVSDAVNLKKSYMLLPI